ncbi:MAG: hypothetical protein ACFB3T_11150, partial [Geminicoccaceae bacterium]
MRVPQRTKGSKPSPRSRRALRQEVAGLREQLQERNEQHRARTDQILARNGQRDRDSEIDSLRASVDDASKLVRNLTFLFLLIGLYIALIGGRTDHEILLRAGDID